MTTTEPHPENKTIKKLKDNQSLFVVAALAITLIATVFRLFTEPGRPFFVIAADWAVLALILVINVFSVLIVAKVVKALSSAGMMGTAYDAIVADRKRKPNAADVTRNPDGHDPKI